MPDGASAVQVIVAQHPVTDEQRAIRCERDADRPKVSAAVEERFSFRRERRASWLGLVALDAVIRPGSYQQATEVLIWQAAGLVAQDLARRFAGAAHHRQRAGQLSVPRLERVPARAAIAELEAVIASLDDMHHAARRRGVRIVIDGKDPAKDVE